MHLDAQHWIWLWQEDQALPAQQVQEVCGAQCLWARAAYDAQQVCIVFQSSANLLTVQHFPSFSAFFFLSWSIIC
jgi:hypothetical protein